jgi:phospholipase/lecithinase/hemolysin
VFSLIVFGDSLCDGGNAYALRGDAAFPCPPHWRGRRCDGPVWVEQLAERLGLPPLVHSLAGGTNHAYGGARSGAGLSPKGMPNLIEQVAGFLEEAPPDPDALVVLRAGANDYIDASPSPAVGEGVNRHLLGAVERLAAAGLRRFLVPSELPWGFSPIQLPGLGEAERRGLNALIARQNAALQEALQDLAARRGLVVVQPDFQALFLAVRSDPAAYGYTEIGRPVLVLDGEGANSRGIPAVAAAPSLPVPGAARDGSAAPCLPFPAEPCSEALGATPAGVGYLWWDSWAHLTTAFHGLLADAALLELHPAEATREL